MANLIVSAVSTFDNKGLKKGQKEISAFDKTIKTLGKTFLGVFGAQKLLQFGKSAVNAFMADEKAAKSLELQLKNTGFAFAAPSVEYYIANLEKTTGVLDDELRPALQRLLTVTGSITKSQEAVSTALNLSAAGYGSVEEISSILAKAYAGQTTALGRLGTGLSKATLKTGNMELIMADLNQRFAGQAAARLDTYAGKMDLLDAAAARAKETIGKGLLDALFLLSKDDSIQTAVDDMDLFAQSIADASYGMASLLKKLDKFTGLDKVKTSTLLGLAFPAAGLLSKYGATERNKPKSNFTYSLGSGATSEISKLKEAAAIKAAAKARAEELRLLNLKNGLENKNVEELKKKFDLERIGLTVALNNATDEETKLRLRAQLAILDNNDALAKKILAEMEAAEALRKLAEAADKLTLAFERQMEILRASIASIFNSIRPELKSLQTIINPTQENLRSSIGAILESTKPAQNALNNLINPSEENLRKTIADSLAAAKPAVDMLNLLTSGSIQRTSSSSPMDIRLTVDAGNDRMSQAIAESIQLATRSGYSTVPNGFLV
jgi:hypothetical protein